MTYNLQETFISTKIGDIFSLRAIWLVLGEKSLIWAILADLLQPVQKIKLAAVFFRVKNNIRVTCSVLFCSLDDLVDAHSFTTRLVFGDVFKITI